MSDRAKRFKGQPLHLRLERNDQVLHEGNLADMQLPFVIGRMAGCAWQVPPDETSVSKTHAEITVRHGRVWIRDLGSRNGLFVMGRKVAEFRLDVGVSVSLGQCRLIVEKVSDSGEAHQLPYHRLECMVGDKVGKFYDLSADVTAIGSAVVDGVSCSSVLVSKRHAEIIHKSDDTCWIRDLGSRNGTTVNGVPLKKVERMLRHRDVVAVADVQFRFWDRNVDPYRSRILLKVCVVLVTAALFGTCYFAVQSIFPSAKVKLAEASDWESKEMFDRAEAALKQADSARGSAYYTDEIARKRRELDIWRNTLEVWKSAKDDFNRRFWIDASTKLGSLIDPKVEKWGWNTTTAQTMKREARLMKSLVDVFLSARSAIRGDFREDERGNERNALVARLADNERMLANPQWAASLPTGKLRSDMEEQRTELRALIADLSEAETCLASIKVPPSEDLKTASTIVSPFPEIVKRLRTLSARSRSREASRAVVAKNEGRNFVASKIVEEKCEEFIPALERFVESGACFTSNLVSLVAGRYDDMVGDLPFPSDQQCSLLPQFGDIRRLMTAVNLRVNGEIRDQVRDQLARLGKWNLEKGEIPNAVSAIFDAPAMEKVFGCDSFCGVRPKSSRAAPSGKYDEILGLEAFADYLKSFDVDREYRYVPNDVRARPVIVDSLMFYRQADSFQRFLDSQDIGFLLAVDVPSGNTLRSIAGIVVALQEKRELLIDLCWNRDAGGLRSKIIARGFALALDTNGKLGVEACEELRKDLTRLKSDIAALKSKIDSNPDCVTEVRPQILKIGIPGLHNVNAWWDQEAKRKADWR